MTARLDLLAHGPSSATRTARFPGDERLEASAVGTLQTLRGKLRSYGCVLASPSRAAQETAAAFGFEAGVEAALQDCDFGRWRGLEAADVAAREPEGFAAWLGDPAASPHGGESLMALSERVGVWLGQSMAREGATLAVTHASVVRAAIVSALGASASALWRIDVAPLSVARLSGRDGRWNLVALGPLGALSSSAV